MTSIFAAFDVSKLLSFYKTDPSNRQQREETVNTSTQDMAASGAAAAAKKKLVVCGGNGFLGSRICKAAVARDWDVVSIRYPCTCLSTHIVMH